MPEGLETRTHILKKHLSLIPRILQFVGSIKGRHAARFERYITFPILCTADNEIDHSLKLICFA